MDQKTRKNDVILIAVLLAAALVFYAGVRYYQEKSTKAGEAVVTVDGVFYGRYPLNKNVIERIELPDGSYNVLEINEGSADITEGSCPDGICVNHRPVSRNSESIVCLPNRVVVEIENGEESDLDSVTN